MMARQPNPDLTNTLTMLHTAVLHTDKNIRDALDKSVETLESAGRTAHDQTTKEVVDELGRMRANFRDVYNKLNSTGEGLNTAAHDVVAQLRTELREVRVALADLTPATPPPAAPRSPYPDVARQETTGTAGLSSAPVTTVTEPGEVREAAAARVLIPVQRTTDEASPDSLLSLDATRQAIREAVREALAEELAPLLAKLTAPDHLAGTPAGDLQDVSEGLRATPEKSHGEPSTAQEETRSALASLQREIADLRTTMEKLRPQPDATAEAEAEAAEVSKEHSALLKMAARVSSAGLLCHRDIWEFITAHAGRHPHFRVPPQVAGEGDERVRAALSGRSLIALLISLHSIKRTANDGDGDQELAATLYERIAESLTRLTPSGQSVTITLDDRTTPAPQTPAANPALEHHDEPKNTDTPSESPDKNPDEEAGPAAA
ncbi:hypothetical protein ABT236_36545 [Streptomyces sp. NPDC001523]|uniref:hypothetical protein n=1 Tax=Streptomyces sp. NPDC001523 TaxID=3154383 RepID=UPI00331E0A01